MRPADAPILPVEIAIATALRSRPASAPSLTYDEIVVQTNRMLPIPQSRRSIEEHTKRLVALGVVVRFGDPGGLSWFHWAPDSQAANPQYIARLETAMG